MDRKIQLGGERSCLLLLIVLKSEKTSSPPNAQTIHFKEFGHPHVSPLSLFASLVSRASCWEGKKRERDENLHWASSPSQCLLTLRDHTLFVSPHCFFKFLLWDYLLATQQHSRLLTAQKRLSVTFGLLTFPHIVFPILGFKHFWRKKAACFISAEQPRLS